MLPLLIGTTSKLLGPSGSTSASSKKISKEKLLSPSDTKKDTNKVKVAEKKLKLLPPSRKINLISPADEIKNIDDKSTKEKSIENLRKKTDFITKTLENIIKFFKLKRKNESKEYQEERKQKEIENKKQKEEDLEKKKPAEAKKIGLPSTPKLSFLDSIMNFFTTILIGSFVKFLYNNSQKIFDMLDDISSGLNNIWNVTRISIISLSTVFRKQIRFVAKLGKNLLKGPIKATKFLFKKLGNSLKTLLKNVGSFVVNNIKRVAGITGSAIGGASTGATRATGTASRAAQTPSGKPARRRRIRIRSTPRATSPSATSKANRFFGGKGSKHLQKVSKIFKKIPFIGALIGIGIDLAMGERLDNAIAGAAGASLGSAIGAGVGSLIFPGLGTLAGGFIGGVVGDWAGKEIYKKLSGQVKQINPPESDLTSPGNVRTGPVRRQISQVQGQVSGGNADFWALAAIASLESGNPQGQADVAQSIYNRAAAGIFPGGKNIKNIITAPSQYSPVHESDPSKWATIVDESTAIAAVASHRRGGANAARMVSNAAQNINNPQLQEEAKSFVGGRTDFNSLGVYKTDPSNAISVVKRHGHRFGFWIGPGSIGYGQSNPGPASAPNLGGVSATPTQSTPTQPNLQPNSQTTPQQGQVSPQQSTRSSEGISRRASYEQQSSPMIVIGGGGQPTGGSYGTGGIVPLPLGMSRKQSLNSYYQAQLTGFLYKQG